MQNENIKRIARYFETQMGKITLCIDGCVDEVWQIVRSRTSRTEYALHDKMSDFAKAVYDVGAGGYANEIVRKRRCPGGFTGNTGKAVARLGGNPAVVGMFGKSGIDPAFAELGAMCELITVGEPSVCQVFEFTDGKILLPFLQDQYDFTWDALAAALKRDAVKAAFARADIVALGYWSHIPAFDEIANGLSENSNCKRMFFDFADIRKRDRHSLETTLKNLARLNSRIRMTLSVNEHEAALIFSYEGKNFDWKQPPNEVEIEYVREKIGLDELVIHTPFFAAAATANEGTAVVPQRFCENPVITTGAGDNFNAGYIVASAADGLALRERLFAANATTGSYIRNGVSPDKSGLTAEMEELRKCL